MQNRYNDIGKNIAKKFDNIIVSLVLFLLCTLPLAIDLRLVKPFSLCKLILFYGTVLFVITVWSIRIVSVYAKNSTSSRKIPRQSILHFYHTPLTYPVLAYITVVLSSTIFSLNRTISVFGYYEHYEGLFTTIGYVIIFFTILTYFKRQHVFYIIFAVSIAVFLSSIYGVMQFLYYDPVSWKEWQDVDDRLKIVSTFGNPVFFSGYIVCVFPLILVGFLIQLKHASIKTIRGKYLTAFLFTVLILMLFNLYITKTRGAWLGFISSLLCVTVLLYLEFIVKHRIKFIISASCFIVFFGLLIGCIYKHSINQLLYLLKQKGDIAVALTGMNTGDSISRNYFMNTRSGQSILYRIIQYKSALDIIRDRPLTGIGPDMLSSVLPRYAFNHYKQSPYTPKFENVLGIHNDILDKATTCGVIGLGTYLWIIVTFVTFVKRRFIRIERNDRLILSGLLACLVGYLVQQQFNVIEYTITLHFWIFLAASVVLVDPTKEKDSTERIATKKQLSQGRSPVKATRQAFPTVLSYLCYLLIMGMLVYGLSYLISIYKADVMHKKGSDFLAYATTHQQSGNELSKNPYWERGLEYYKASILYNPRQTVYRYQLCEAYLFMLRKDLNNIDLIRQTIKECEEIIRIDPNEDFALNYLANAYDLLEYNTKKDYSDKIILTCERAISINPYKLSYYDCLGTYYIKKGLYEKAVLMYKQIFHMKSDYPRIAEKLTNAYKPFIKYLIGQERLDDAGRLLCEIQTMPHQDEIYLKKLKTLLHGKRGQWEDVIKESEQILLAKSDDIDAYQNIATAYYVMKKYDEAKKILEKILQLSSNNKIAHDLLQEINNREHKDAAHQ